MNKRDKHKMTDNIMVIGLVGKMGSGKNWISENVIAPYL